MHEVMGAVLRRWRGSRLQEEIEALSGISQATISRIEAGKSWPRPDTIEALCRALGHTSADLMAEAAREGRA